ncbi:MAG: hypothetical protein MJ232_08940 [archaeon]|nr:hypothetical protein [archaeon]
MKSKDGTPKDIKTPRKDYLKNITLSKIQEINTIINNASEQCSKLKIFFISFCLPATATFVNIFFTLFKDCKYDALRILDFVAIGFYVMLCGIAIYTHYTFYSIQYKYRKVKDSIETLNEKIIFLQNEIEDDITSETFRAYYHAVNNVSKKTNRKWRVFLKTLTDGIPYIVPILIIIAFFVSALFWGGK